MAKRTLIIDGDDHDHFFLSVEDGILRIGEHPERTEGVLSGMRISRIRCELEVDDGPDNISLEQTRTENHSESITPCEVRVGEIHQLGHAHFALQQAEELGTIETVSLSTEATVEMTSHIGESGSTATRSEPEPPTVSRNSQAKRLRVADGADVGRCFPLPESGSVSIGKNSKYSDIILHDLYVSRVHCTLEIDEGQIVVTHVEGDSGTLIDGQRIERAQILRPNSVLRVGNSHLLLEVGEAVTEHTESPSDDEAGYEVLDSAKAARTTNTPPATRSSDPLARLEGQLFGHYLLKTVLGTGHTGTVFRAMDEKSQQSVAVKVFPPNFPASAGELERFARATKSASQIHHPNLVAVLGAGKTGSHCWIAREYVDGECISKIIDRVHDGEKPSWTRTARVAYHLSEALECLHRHRAVHGNITPRNILVASADHATKLTDLGLSHALEDSQLAIAMRPKKLFAELPYLAPEQTEPGAFVDDLADLYAVGAVLYAMLTGRPPFSGKTPEEITEQIQHGRLLKPSQHYKKVSLAFEGIVLKLLSRHQEDRYQTAASLLADLTPLVDEHSISV